jgi:hypothetical protein
MKPTRVAARQTAMAETPPSDTAKPSRDRREDDKW